MFSDKERIEGLTGSLMAYRDMMPEEIAVMMQQDLMKFAPQETQAIEYTLRVVIVNMQFIMSFFLTFNYNAFLREPV